MKLQNGESSRSDPHLLMSKIGGAGDRIGDYSQG